MKTSSIALATVVTAMVAAIPAAAQAQTPISDRAFVTVDVGAQPQQRSLATSQSFSLYDETASITSSEGIKNGPIFEVSAGYKFTERFGVSVGVSGFQSSSSASAVAVIPDPIFANRPKTVTADLAGLTHREVGIHLRAIFFIPVSDKFDVELSAGPSIIRTEQQLISSATVPTGTQTVTVTADTQSGNAIGVNAGFAANYWLMPHAGVGIFAGYAGGKVNLPSAPDLQVGGVRAGIGITVRF